MTSEALYFEDFQVGAVFSSPARTITETDIVNFAGISGDYNDLHMNDVYAKQSIFGERVAHGLLGLTIASGLFTRTDLNRQMSTTLLALLGLNEWNFHKPIKIGDTIQLEVEIIDKKQTRNSDRGVVTFKRKVLNQRNEIVQEGITPMLVLTKASMVKEVTR